MTARSTQDRLLRVIPGGAHTYSRGFDQFPANAPAVLARGTGCHVFAEDGRRFIDYGMGLRSVAVGYAESAIARAAIEQIELGNNLTRPSLVELEAAERFVDLIPSAEMVKFTKNGSTAVTAAVKLARAATGRSLVLRCREHPFFSYDDWFIESTPVTKGIPSSTRGLTHTFPYGDLPALDRLLTELGQEVACVLLEPATDIGPHPNNGGSVIPRYAQLQPGTQSYLHGVGELCRRHGCVFVLDEMITGFRWHSRGAQAHYNVLPDLCTFGKAMANGFSVAAVAGRRDIMELGSIEFLDRERVFLLSTTHGAEMSGLGAFLATARFYEQHPVVDHLWQFGESLISGLNKRAEQTGVGAVFSAYGHGCSPYFVLRDETGAVSLPLRTLFLQEMARRGILMPWIALSYRHGDVELETTFNAAEESFSVLRRALRDGIEGLLEGPVIKPVFRQFN